MYRRKGHSNRVTEDAEIVPEKKCRNAWNVPHIFHPEFPRMGQPAAVGSSPGPFALAARPVTPSSFGIAIGSKVSLPEISTQIVPMSFDYQDHLSIEDLAHLLL